MRTLVVFRSAALGDFILASPALHTLRKLYPDHHIVLLTTQSASRAIRDSVAQYSPTDGMPWVQLAMPHLIDEVVPMGMSFSPRYLLGIRRSLAVHRIDRVVMLVDPGAPWLGRIKKLLLLRVLTGLVPIVGWRAKGSLNGDRAALHRAGLLPHHALGSLQFAAELKPPHRLNADDVVIDLRPPQPARSWAIEWLRCYVPAGRRLVFVAPGSIQPHKRWPLDSYLALSRQLLERRSDIHVVVIGTPEDHALGVAIQQLAPSRITNVAGATTVVQSAGLLQHGALLVGNDGGAMHLGDAMGCTTISLVPGIQYPDSIEPWNSRRLAIRHDVPCAPCYSFVSCPQGHNQCMRDMPIDRVLEQCLTVLQVVPVA